MGNTPAASAEVSEPVRRDSIPPAPAADLPPVVPARSVPLSDITARRAQLREEARQAEETLRRIKEEEDKLDREEEDERRRVAEEETERKRKEDERVREEEARKRREEDRRREDERRRVAVSTTLHLPRNF